MTVRHDDGGWISGPMVTMTDPGLSRAYGSGRRKADTVPGGRQFVRKAAFLAEHKAWSIDYDRETDAYVAVRKDASGETVVVQRQMKALLDDLERITDDDEAEE